MDTKCITPLNIEHSAWETEHINMQSYHNCTIRWAKIPTTRATSILVCQTLV